MHNRHYWVYHGHIGTQCEFALLAFKKIKQVSNEITAPWPSEELVQQFWFSVSAFLVAYGNISKAFYPPQLRRKGKLTQKMVDKRGVELRSILGNQVALAFEERTIRNDYEHFDARLDEWFYFSEDHRLVDSSILPEPLLAEFPDEDILRAVIRSFKEGNYVLRFTKAQLDLNKAVDAIKRLKASLDQHPPNWDEGEYVSPSFNSAPI